MAGSDDDKWGAPTRRNTSAAPKPSDPPPPPKSPNADHFAPRKPSARKRGDGRLIVVGGRGGGVGKSSTVAHVAEMCAQEGLSVIGIDEKSQGDLRRRLGFGDDRTLLQIAEFWDGNADTIEDWVCRNDELKSDWIVGPDSSGDEYDDEMIPDELFGRLVDVLLGMYDIVVVDTHPAVRRTSSQFYTTWIPRVRLDVRHAIILVCEWDRAKLNSTVEFTTNLLNEGVDSARIFFLGLLSERQDRGVLTFDRVANHFRMVQIANPIPRSDAVADGNNGLTKTVMGGWQDPQYERAIRSLLYQVLGDERFAPVEQRRGFFKRLMGRK